ncbi:hypothetical protein GALMADRAFT_63284 [Galerina marginata CBS 339.88]|uniref:Nucleoporin NDC1 n=1 Tax=Galerina marginata (strain CBS 339.88) TaxID=685588 RepID=A0A067TKA2_GALM3|nr:hypothetical protein GALMADRAFT_63284 [Galerina marginata CBS 339.88]
MSATVANASSSRIGTTPVRAITSTIASRSAPSIPPAFHAYEPLVKSLFRHRLKFILLFSALSTWFINGSWVWWQVGGNQNIGFLATLSFPFSPLILCMSFLNWAAVALPAIVLRKTFLTARRSGATSPLGIVKSAFAKNSTKIALLTYSLSALASLTIHTIMAHQHEVQARGDPKLSLFVKSKKHPHYLNGRLLFLFFTQIFSALAFSVHGAMADRFVYRWNFAVSLKDSSKYLVILGSFLTSAVFTTLAILMGAIAFASARMPLPILYKIPMFSPILRPFTAHFLKGQWTMLLPFSHLPLLFRAWFLAFSTFLTAEISDSLFEHVVSSEASFSSWTTPVSSLSADPNTALISGVTSTDRIFKFFAYAELKDLSTDNSASATARRMAIFGDQKTALNLWACLLRESLLLLGEDYQLFLRRGRPVPPPAATPVKPIVLPTPKIATPTPLLRQRVFKTTQESPVHAALDALASDGPIAKVVEVGADASHVPELFRSVETKVTSPIAEEAKKSVASATSFGSRLNHNVIWYTTSVWKHYAPESLREAFTMFLKWCTEERTSKIVEATLPYRELDVAVIDVLSNLTCASLTEDRYGVVQRDIPRILEAMVSYLSAIEEYQVELTASQKSASSSILSDSERQTLIMEHEKSQEILCFIGDGLKEGIGRIVRTFGDKLTAFKFPPRIAQKLQAFLDYS